MWARDILCVLLLRRFEIDYEDDPISPILQNGLFRNVGISRVESEIKTKRSRAHVRYAK